ncbi:DUF7619 domain-containing protein [Flavobacterium terrigena]|uniref:Conserved repeat domain-containing protein/Por secretion system C-terminal sorting domain-containing protein n=1 Tax=Flavobacterium terrigena TaxID=402734 RepID=A0A1H6VC44_9FLAO|nr:T9SS type A sorting domain-containing protein [Flavobacterium terrigena]SEJ02153.1 conserved repeat domain-containing protein/Por secretion system C-terminal sorting domain-containing protein [Flavobacterium terrigena]
MKKIYFLVTFLATFFTQAQIVNIPNSLFKAYLIGANTTNSRASIQIPNSYDGTVTSYNKIDTNSDGEIQVSEAILIKYLDLSSTFNDFSSIEGINSFSNLQFFNCELHALTSMDISGLTNLKWLKCRANLLTSLNISNLTNLTYLQCNGNPLTSLNINTLTNLKDLSCTNTQLTSLNISALTNLNSLNCSYNQLTNLDLSTLTNLKSLWCYNNQLTSLDVSNSPLLQNLECNDNLLTNLNVNGITTSMQYFKCNNNQLTNLNLSTINNIQYIYCDNNQLTNLDVSDFTFLYFNCSNNQLITLFLNNTGSSLTFNNNPNLAYVCVSENYISQVTSIVNDYGYSATCNVGSYCKFTPFGIYYTINGTNKIDVNNNGCDTIYPNLKYTITDGSITSNLISNNSGNYLIPVSAGTHTITPQLENPSYFTVFPTSASVTFPATPSPFVQNFCITPNGTHHDLEVVIIPLTPARPGFDATYKIKYKNKGNLSETATLVFNYNDSVLDFVSSTLAPNSQSTGSLSWNIGTITPSQNGEFIVTLNVNSPTETPAVNPGYVLNYSAVINGLNTDDTPIDNTFSLNQTVVNSFDPNDKTCLEGNTINPSMIGEYVHYKIRFENTGTFPAENIVVKDMIDTAKFDISTLQMTDASHACVTRISNPNKVEFIFENINLPFDDATNDGYVAFKIKTKNTLVVGSTISNLANIYFDYNFPIVTNTATSTFQVLQNDSFVFDNYFSVYPNPAKEVLNLKTKQDVTVYSLSIYSILGQQLQTITNPEQTIDVSNLKTGNYFIKIVTDKGISSSKFIKE